MRQSEFKKKKNDPDAGKYTRQHIWSGEREVFGEGVSDKIRSFGSKVFGKKTKKQVNFAPPPPPPKTTKKGGDKIVKMLSKKKPPAPSKKKSHLTTPVTQQDINNRVPQIMTRGKII